MSNRPFEFPSDLSGFSREAQSVLLIANDLGWRVTRSGQHMAAITSPVGDKIINIPSTNVNANRVRSWLRALRTYTPAEVFEDWMDNQPESKVKAHRTAFGLPVPKPSQVVTPKPQPPVTAFAAAMAEAEQRAGSETTPLTITPTAVRTPSIDDTVAGKTLVSETPWMVRKDGIAGSTGRMYESHAVIHRVWSDGTEDYRCRFCEYTNEAGRSVSAHAAKSKDHPAASKTPEYRQVPVYEPSGIKHSETSVRRLTSELLRSLDSIEGWQGMDQEALAHALAEHLHDQRPDREPVAPLTPEQIMRRIALMVDGGRLAEMHQQVERTAAALREKTDLAAAAVAEAEQLRHDVAALREERRALAAMLSDEAS